MDIQNKVNHGPMDGVESRGAKDGGGRISFLLLRLMALLLTLAATIVLGVNKQTKVVPIQLLDSLPPLNIPVVAEWQYLSSFVFFVVSNAIACTYAAVSLVLCFSRKKSWLLVTLLILDVLMVALLFSGNGATAAIGVLGYKGNSHVRWNRVCNVFGKFCNQVAAAVALSLLGSIVFMLLVMLAALRLHNKSK